MYSVNDSKCVDFYKLYSIIALNVQYIFDDFSRRAMDVHARLLIVFLKLIQIGAFSACRPQIKTFRKSK